MNKPTDEEVDRVMNWASDRIDSGETYGGMTYEQGVQDALMWVRGYSNTPPDEG